MSRYVSRKDRRLVQKRSLSVCEYCRFPELFSFLGYEIDHIIPVKHGGSNDLENLAWVCSICNKNKGTDVGTFLLPDLNLVRFYHPRRDNWNEHFDISGSLIKPRTNIGEATVKILQLNDANRLDERELLLANGLFPPPHHPLSDS